MKVSELVEKLQQLPQDSDAVILDADTDWLLNIETVEHDSENDVSFVRGSYGNEHSGRI